MRRRDFIALIGGATAVLSPFITRAQQSGRVRRIGILIGLAEDDLVGRSSTAVLLEELGKLGWREPNTIRIDFRWAGGDTERVKIYANELVGLAPDLLLADAPAQFMALRQAAPTIPIVFVMITDPVGRNFVTNASRPGGNVTGFGTFEFSMGGKWLQMLKELDPEIRRVSFIGNPQTTPYDQFLRSIEESGSSLAVQVVAARVHSSEDIESAIAAMAGKPKGAFIVPPDTFINASRPVILESATRYGVPAIYPFRYFALSGGLVSYGIDRNDIFRRVASYIDRILQGTSPGELPVQTPTKFELVINLKTAKALGIAIPQSILLRADEVIE